MRSITDKKKKAQTWDLSHLLAYAKLLHVRIPRLSDELTMRESKEIERRILEEIHPYRIYENKNVPGQWATHLPDPDRKDGRRLIRRNSYERICQAVIEYYIEDLSFNINLDTLFDDWIIFRRDETSEKGRSKTSKAGRGETSGREKITVQYQRLIKKPKNAKVIHQHYAGGA